MKITIELTVEQARAIHSLAQFGIEEWQNNKERSDIMDDLSTGQIDANDEEVELWDQAQYEIERALADVGGPTR